MRTTRATRSTGVGGRPLPRFFEPSYFRATGVPAKNRRRSHQPGELVERLAPQRLAPHREPATLSIGQPQPPVPQLLSEHPVLLEQVLDCELLPTVDPARHDQDEKLERERELRHPLILSPRPSADNSPDFAE
jgi:hypothetical protein